MENKIDLEKVKIENFSFENIQNFFTYENLKGFLDNYLYPFGLKLISALIIFLIGKFVVRKISHFFGFLTQKTLKDEMLAGFISSISYFLMLLIVVIVSLSQLGVDTTSLVALLGAAGLAIGLSLQDSLKNFAAGVMILIFKPFKKGDFVDIADGTSGTVINMGILMVELKMPDGKQILIPNAMAFSSKIINFNINKVRRIEIISDIAYSANIKLAKEIVEKVIQNNKKVLKGKDYEIVIGVSELGASSVKILSRCWVESVNFIKTQFELIEEIKLEFDKNGIEIPFNQLDVHLIKKD